MSSFYTELCNMFIRPTRQFYNSHDLGNASLGELGRRIDFQTTNPSNLKLVCSFFRNTKNPLAPCIIYLHGFNGSRLQSLSYVHKILSLGLNMCSFDFSGTGISQGTYVSLGHHEQFDIFAVVKALHQKYNIAKFALWGRSMGAVAAIKFYTYLDQVRKEGREKWMDEIVINSLVLDSPFYSLSSLAIEIARTRVKIPELLIKAVFLMIQSTIESKANFKMEDLQLQKYVKQIHCPVLLLSSKDDTLIHFSHSEKIYEAIKHRQKEILFIRGEHNDPREQKMIQYLLSFMKGRTKNERTERHLSCMTYGRKLKSYQSTKFMRVVEEEEEYLQKIDSNVRIRYFPEQSGLSEQKTVKSLFPKEKIGSSQQVEGLKRQRQTKIKTLKEISQSPQKNKSHPSIFLSPFYKQKGSKYQINCHQLQYSTEVQLTAVTPKKEEERGTKHMNIINEKLRRKKKVKANEEKKREKEYMSLKSIEEIKPKDGLKVLNKEYMKISPMVRSHQKEGLSFSTKIS